MNISNMTMKKKLSFLFLHIKNNLHVNTFLHKNVKKSCCINTTLFMLSYTVSNIVRLNGLYDILCGACLLNIIRIPILNTLHADMFHPALATNDFASRLLGYWIITYGTIRLCHDTHSPLVSLSYYLEAICLWNEMNYHPHYSRLLFTSILSAYCGYTYTHLQK